MSATPATKSVSGSCHCGFIKYQAELPATDPPVATRCNCSICLKQGFTGIRLTPADFTLLSPDRPDQTKEYQLTSKRIHKYFCDTCGVHVWAEGRYEWEGQQVEFFSLNALTLDQPQEGLNLNDFKIQYWDGKNDNWAAGPKDTPWPGGCI